MTICAGLNVSDKAMQMNGRRLSGRWHIIGNDRKWVVSRRSAFHRVASNSGHSATGPESAIMNAAIAGACLNLSALPMSRTY